MIYNNVKVIENYFPELSRSKHLRKVIFKSFVSGNRLQRAGQYPLLGS